jgi:hypothetical protein
MYNLSRIQTHNPSVWVVKYSTVLDWMAIVIDTF